MDVDNDIDTQLLQQFSSMGTTDKEVLISQFQQLLGNQLNAAGCAFFLDMNNWNLQAAVCSYYDYEQPNARVPCMAFVRDVTIGEGESVPPNTNFVKTWQLQNTGEECWPPGCCLRFVGGEQFGHRDRIMSEALQPGQVTDISVEMVSPVSTGIYEGQWRMSTTTGLFFGEIIWVILQVDESGLLGLTQQLSQFGTELVSQNHCSASAPASPATNPFATPTKDFGDCPSMGDCGSPAQPAGWVSPSLSVIAHSGSLPGSPAAGTAPILPPVDISGTSPSHIRSLFQTPDMSPNTDTHLFCQDSQSDNTTDMS